MTVTVYAPGLTVEVLDRVVVPPPPPPPPVDLSLGVVDRHVVNLAKTLMLPGYMSAPYGYDPGRYERYQRQITLTGDAAQLRATTNSFSAGGAKLQFGAAASLTLTFNGVPVATKDVIAADTSVTFAVDLTAVAEGWYRTSVNGLDASWSILDYAVYVRKGALAQPQAKMPVIGGSYLLAFHGEHQWAWVPAKAEPVLMPLVPRECPHFTEAPRRANLHIMQLVIGRSGDTYHPCISKDGVLTTANQQPYNFFDFQQPVPKYPMLDGPRGRGTLFCPTHLEVGKAAPTAAEGAALGPIDNTYFCDPWRFGKVRENGDVVTLAGWRHASLPGYWDDPQNAELVGDWSAIPQARRGFHEIWGLAWRVPATDYSAAPIAMERNLRPHVSGVQAFIADQRRVMPNGVGRIVKLQFSPTSHSTPPVVTELSGDGWNQCFDVVGKDGLLYGSDRMGNRIRVLSMDTGEVLENWPVAMPEGLHLFDRNDGTWLYYSTCVRQAGNERGGIISWAIRRRHLVTREDVLVCDKTTAPEMAYYINGNTLLFKFGMSTDGSFGPRGMIGLATWSNSYYGYPMLIDAETGKWIPWLTVQQYVDPPIKGLPSPAQTYTSAVGFGNGRMVWGSACEGLFAASKVLPTDTAWSAAAVAGETEWTKRGLHLTHGHYGFGHYGLPLPWGVTAETDEFLLANGHIRGN